MQNDKSNITFYYSKPKIVFFFLVLSFMLTYFISIFYNKQIHFQSIKHMLFIVLFCGGLITYFIITIIKLLAMLFDSRPAVILDNEGVLYQPNPFISFMIPWSYMYEIKTRQIKLHKYPLIHFDYNPLFFSDISILKKIFFYPKLLFKTEKIMINTSLLNVSYHNLYNILTDELEKSKAND